jgi:uncharacterized protein YjbI with pentapeptide repeats
MIRRSKPMSQSLPAGLWSSEQMFETIRVVNMLRADRSVARSWASQVLAEQVQRVSSAREAGQISTADANRYLTTLFRELEQQQSGYPRIFGRNASLIFRGIAFDNLLLQDFRVRDAYFSICTFKGSNLYASKFAQCTFSDCSFEQADMRRANFFKSRIHECGFQGALLDHALFRKSSLTQCDFENASMTSTRGVPRQE